MPGRDNTPHNFEHIDPLDVIRETAEVYENICKSTRPSDHVISRQVKALAYVLTDKINDKLLEIENALE